MSLGWHVISGELLLKLELLATWIDLIDHERGEAGTEVQEDLRRMAALAREGLAGSGDAA